MQATRISKPEALRLVGKIVDIDEEVRRRAELERRTQRDNLTDLLNKTPAFRDKISAAMPVKPQQDKADALLFLDLIILKLINDTFGHIKGDEALLAASEVLTRIFRNADAVGCFGGDEFCVPCPHHPLGAQGTAEALLSELHSFIEQDGQTVEITTSIGIYQFDGTESSYDVALHRADNAQYVAKQAGKTATVFMTSSWMPGPTMMKPTKETPTSRRNSPCTFLTGTNSGTRAMKKGFPPRGKFYLRQKRRALAKVLHAAGQQAPPNLSAG